ncbi:MAG TPA: copper resistance protein B [Woeseiaceae bacterium]|nr:copper resistance protein B [Woeseiaceae bacterium]
MKLYTATIALVVLWPASAHAYEPAGTPPDWDPPMDMQHAYWKVLADRFEAGIGDNLDGYVWDVQGWYGGDHNRVWMKTEGEGELGSSPEHAELQLLFSRMFAPFWDWQIGVRQDLEPNPDRTHLVLGIQGVVPYQLEWDSALFVSDEGDVSARIEVEYDLNITQRWVLQPHFEINAAFSDDRELGIGTGVNNTELGLRVRYHVQREIAPYLGVSWQQLYGGTRDFAQDDGKSTSNASIVVGVRFWF